MQAVVKRHIQTQLEIEVTIEGRVPLVEEVVTTSSAVVGGDVVVMVCRIDRVAADTLGIRRRTAGLTVACGLSYRSSDSSTTEHSTASQGTVTGQELLSHAWYTQKEEEGKGQGLDNFDIIISDFETHHSKDGKRVVEVVNTSKKGYYAHAQTPSATIIHGEQAILPKHKDGYFRQVRVTYAAVEHEKHTINSAIFPTSSTPRMYHGSYDYAARRDASNAKNNCEDADGIIVTSRGGILPQVNK